MTGPFYAAACQTDFPCPADRTDIAERTRRMCQMVEQAITGYEPFFDVRSLAFPEFAHAANQGASLVHYAPFSWHGGSMIVDYDGRILAQADPGPGEKIVVGPIGIDALRAERQRRRGHDMRAHLRSGIHTYLSEDRLEPAKARPLCTDEINLRIQKSRQRLR